MRRRPIQIELSLQEGIPHGAIRLAHRNLRGIAYKIPRSRLLGYFKRLERERSEALENKRTPEDTCLDRACVYILFGADDVSEKEGRAYIGESEDIAGRLRSHNSEKEFWNDAIVLCRTDDDFNKGSILYIEGQLIDLAKKIDRFALVNTDRASNEKPLNAGDRSVADDFIDDATILVELLGCKIFATKRESSSTRTSVEVEAIDSIPTFYIMKGDTVIATGQRTNDGFVIFEGSEIAEPESPNYPPKIKRIRESLIQDGSIIDGKLAKDCVFPSPTGAAWAVLDNASGTTAWKMPLESGIPPADCKRWKTFAEWRAEQGEALPKDAAATP